MAAQCGTGNLARLLNKLLVAHIRSVLPGLRRSLSEQTAALARELEALGQEHPEGRAAQAAFLLQASRSQFSRPLGLFSTASSPFPVLTPSPPSRFSRQALKRYATAFEEMIAGRCDIWATPLLIRNSFFGGSISDL